ncbi:divergent polysaccharide deacetylase family protein [Hyphomonas sp.]|uniref:divergent polysaccharide deacetylase family protein n=1 Tax=Hyphomonas sp. TaxID=87 RepID=UPI0039189484
MGYRRESEPSPLRTGIVHAGMSLAVFGGLAASLGAGIHVVADPESAGPRQTLALFDTVDDVLESQAQARVADFDGFEGAADFDTVETASALQLALTELEGEALRIEVTGGQGGPAVSARDAIRINGQIVRSGESLSQVRSIGIPSGTAVRVMAANSAPAPVSAKKPASRAPADVYARSFSNADGRPMVGLVIGGLGINATQTQLAIDDLPAEVTLSFALDSKRLDYWIKTARADGHEVLIEVPMEAYDYGRMKMHPDTLLAAADAKSNLARLDAILSRTSGYFGVVNYQGAKFAANADASSAVLQRLADRGIAFIDDGSVERGGFASPARASGVRYARAAGPIDTRQSPDEINAELLDLETLARDKGAAFGSGYAFPVTVEAAKVWIAQLPEKGLVLAPVSAITRERSAAAGNPEVRTGSLGLSGLNTGG